MRRRPFLEDVRPQTLEQAVTMLMTAHYVHKVIRHVASGLAEEALKRRLMTRSR
jgi:hypothetical protein